MKFTGALKKPVIDYDTLRPMLVFASNEDFSQAYEELKGYDKLSLEIKPYRKKRSLDANGYYWTLVAKLARIMKMSNPELHNKLLCEYGYPVIIDGQAVRTPLPDTEETDRKVRDAMEYHLKPTTEVKEGKDGVMYRTYLLMRGSSTYNTEEMARLIDGLIDRCREAGMPDCEIVSPDEKRILKERYGVNIDQKTGKHFY